VPEDGVTVTVEDIQAHAKTRLASFRRPKYVVLARFSEARVIPVRS